MSKLFSNCQKVVSFEARPSDKCTINIGLCRQNPGIIGFYAATILDYHLTGRCCISKFCQLLTDQGMDFLGLFRRRDLSSADCPDWFIGNDRRGKVGRTEPSK